MSVKKIPLRQCIGCGEMKSKKEMIRVIKTAEGEILLDATGRKNGRGAYLCPSMECFKKAVKGRGLERSFKMAIPREVYETLEKEMEELAHELTDAVSVETRCRIRTSCGTIALSLKEVSRSYKEAKMALEVAAIFYKEKNVITYEELGIGRLIYQLPIPLCEMLDRKSVV